MSYGSIGNDGEKPNIMTNSIDLSRVPQKIECCRAEGCYYLLHENWFAKIESHWEDEIRFNLIMQGVVGYVA